MADPLTTLTAVGVFLAGAGAVVSGIGGIYRLYITRGDRDRYLDRFDGDDDEPPPVMVRPPQTREPGKPRHRRRRGGGRQTGFDLEAIAT